MTEHIHILGICGTFMGGLALLAKDLGYRVSGSDANVYPPMSTQLEQAGIELMEGYAPEHLQPAPDLVVVGNAMTRGNPAIEYLLNQKIPYISGPQWLGEKLLNHRWVLGVSGTHGKTTTTSMLTWILEYAGMSPGFLIGGVPANFGRSAALGESDFFVIEADEYDTAFFDKRSKFVHYRPNTLVIGNLEFDHADIFADLAAIETQFHHLVRCVPGEGMIIRGQGEAIDRVIQRGCWTPVQVFGANGDWAWRLISDDGSHFAVHCPDGSEVEVQWNLLGMHNVANGVAAIAAARHVGVPPAVAVDALQKFEGVKRRLELRGTPNGVEVYDDFAHHPTAIASTLAGMRANKTSGRIVAVIEPRSNTMRAGVHEGALAQSVSLADRVFWYQPPGLDWSLGHLIDASGKASLATDIDNLIDQIAVYAQPSDAIVIMSNGGFGGLHERLLARLAG